MADYYPLLAKAVANLSSSTPESRKAIYERARNALLGQLRAMQPPAPEAAIARESLALDTAIDRLEKEFALFPAAAEPAASAVAETAAPEPAPEPPPPPAKPIETEVDKAESLLQAFGAPRETLRPAAPKPETGETGSMQRLGIILGALALVVILLGVAAWKLRDNPEDLARMTPQPEVADQSGGKIGDRLGAAPTAGDSSRPASPALPVSYRSAILLQAPSEPGGVKTYVGTAVWRRDAANRGPNQQLASAVHVDVDIPDARFKVAVTIEKNYEAALSVSHTFTVRFIPGADSPIGDVKAVNMPEMRRDGADKGASLQGLPVDIAPNVFLIGLASTAEAQNLDLLKSVGWFDIPMSLANGRVAKVTFEKGAMGDKIVSDALTEWSAPQ